MLFRRRDTRLRVLLFGGFPALGCFTIALGTPWWSLALQGPLAVAVWCGIGAVVLHLRRRLPPDLVLRWIGPADAARLRAAAPPPDRTVLHVRFEPDWMRRYRLDVLVDGQRVAQLPPGAAFMLPLRPGEHQVTMFLDNPRSVVRETVNSIPGAFTGFRVRNRGSRAVELEIRREATLPADTRLVRPAVAEA